MMSSRTLLKGAAIGRSAPEKVMMEVNEHLNENNETSMFVTLFFANYDPSSGNLIYSNAGHNPPFIVHPDGSTTLFGSNTDLALGVVPDIAYRQESVRLEPGDMAIFYTDGVTEAENETQEQFGMERLADLFKNSPPNNAREANDAVFEAVNEFSGTAPQFDDITCLTLYRSR